MNGFRHAVLSVALAGISAVAVSVEAQTLWFSAQLEGANEVGNAGDSDGGASVSSASAQIRWLTTFG